MPCQAPVPRALPQAELRHEISTVGRHLPVIRSTLSAIPRVRACCRIRTRARSHFAPGPTGFQILKRRTSALSKFVRKAEALIGAEHRVRTGDLRLGKEPARHPRNSPTLHESART